ncbi:MAG: ATP-binding protein [Spirochaetaceae bacterium]|jgi:predicted AAA+ superfamily ATPase|nr:ATP-binding protein [Spirochaetaceae bacterium]
MNDLSLNKQTCVSRPRYLEFALNYLDKPLIKVITGMRRSGKSVILKLIRQELLNRGIAPERILYINFESQETAPFSTQQTLYQYIKDFAKEGRFYLLLDEVQYVENWERVLASCRVDFNCDIFITGSNAKLLSGELATLLSGRYINIPVYPLSFEEFLQFRNAFTGENAAADRRAAFFDYLRFGGLPGIHEIAGSAGFEPDIIRPYLIDIFNSVLLKDVISRKQIRDTELLERIVRFVMDNIGHIVSAKSISDFLKHQGRKHSTETVYNYLAALSEAYLLRKIGRYDIKGKRQLETLEKYYAEDAGIQNAVYGYHETDISGLLENAVCLELLRRGYAVSIGQLPQKEIDFIATKGGEKIYIQVAYLLADKAVIDREFSGLEEIQDNYPKLVLSMDPVWEYNREGIIRRNIIDWLLDSH